MRRLSHAGTIAFTLVGLMQVGVSLAYGGVPPLGLFLAILAVNQFLISFALPNFNALALEPLGAVAGTASSLIGFYTTILGAACGYMIGQSFDGTVMPIGIGYTALGALSLLVIAWTERGRLFGYGSST
jgi:MFS transporter, DHA1 family, multidrug resistance protein